MPSEFHNREPPLPFGNPESRPWYGMDIFWNRPICFTNLVVIKQNNCSAKQIHTFLGNLDQLQYIYINNYYPCYIFMLACHLNMKTCTRNVLFHVRSRYGEVVRVLTSHRCGLGLIPGLDTIHCMWLEFVVGSCTNYGLPLSLKTNIF